MKTESLKKGGKYWCWWMSRYLYYTGETVQRQGKTVYVFRDICDAYAGLTAKDVERLG